MKPLENLAINTIRFLSVDAINKANSGHPGLPMGASPMAYTLWRYFLRFSAAEPAWQNRDRFVLSAGHGSMLLYSLLHLFGYPLSMEDLQSFRQFGSKTPGHPEYGFTEGVETTTGPLGQGFANAVGMAMAERHLAEVFNRRDFPIVDHYTYALAGDGDLMEGITYEAASLAGTLKLDKLIVLYDDNHITIDGSTDLSFTEDVKKRFEALSWKVLQIENGNDIGAIRRALIKAQKSKGKPILLMVRTQIGYGSPNRAGTSKAHGAPLGEEETRLTREALGYDYPPFTVPEEVKTHFENLQRKKHKDYLRWQERMKDYQTAYPELYEQYQIWHQNSWPSDLTADDSFYKTDKPKAATRAAAGEILNRIAAHVPNLVGGSADLNESTKTYLKDRGDFGRDEKGANVFFGIREHAMGAIVNGLCLHGGLRAFGSTFLVFSDYMRTPIRLASLMKLPSLFIFTHDSVGVGEDGPTHQPIEHVTSLRLIPGISLWRPADFTETAYAYQAAFEKTDGPSIMVLTRQDLPVLGEVSADARRGGYVLRKERKEKPDVILMGSGSEVSHLLKAQEILQEQEIDARVVSMPNINEFLRQDAAWQEAVLPKESTHRISLEAGSMLSWKELVGQEGKTLGIDTFGASGPIQPLMEHFGLTAQAVVQAAREMLHK